jgi:hypothetical protein
MSRGKRNTDLQHIKSSIFCKEETVIFEKY